MRCPFPSPTNPQHIPPQPPPPQGAGPHVDVLPLPGRVALFLSAEVAHEVGGWAP